MNLISLRRIRPGRKQVRILNRVIDFLFDVAWERNQREKLNDTHMHARAGDKSHGDGHTTGNARHSATNLLHQN